MGSSQSQNDDGLYWYKGVWYVDSYGDEYYINTFSPIYVKLKNNPNKVLRLPPLPDDMYMNISAKIKCKSKIQFDTEGRVRKIVAYHPITNVSMVTDLEKYWIGG